MQFFAFTFVIYFKLSFHLGQVNFNFKKFTTVFKLSWFWHITSFI